MKMVSSLALAFAIFAACGSSNPVFAAVAHPAAASHAKPAPVASKSTAPVGRPADIQGNDNEYMKTLQLDDDYDDGGSIDYTAMIC